jgi:ribosomal protein S18 acetylase RimI-like enzyme
VILKCLYIDTVDDAFLELDRPYEAGFLDAEALLRYAGRPHYDLPESFVRRALSAHDECFAIRVSDELAAYGWYATRANHFSDELTLHFDRRWVYMYRGYTNPEYRGRRLHAIGMTMALAEYQRRGFKGLVSCVEASNVASLRSVYRMGYRHFGTIYAIRAGRLLGLGRTGRPALDAPIAWCTPGCRRFGFRLERRNGPIPAGRRPQPLKV